MVQYPANAGVFPAGQPEIRLRSQANLVHRAHVSFGQHQDQDTYLGADQKTRGL